MKKYIIMMLLSSFIGIFSNPEILSASNSVAVTGLDNSNIVETVIPEVEEPVYEASYETYYETSYETSYEAPAPQMQSYWVSIYTGGNPRTVVEYPSYSDIYQTGKLVYAHNTAGLFGDLKDLHNGDMLMVDGVTYKVSNREEYAEADVPMAKLIRDALGHNIALMTCYGVEYGNGDASHRLVIFADAI